MDCPECGSPVPLQKSLKREKSQDVECPECGEELEKGSPTLLEK